MYDQYISLWPKEVPVGDGYSAGKEGFLFPELNRIHSDIEDRIDFSHDHWSSIFSWSMFQAIHVSATLALSRGQSTIVLLEIPVELIDKYIRFNLAGESWQAEREQYLGIQKSL